MFVYDNNIINNLIVITMDRKQLYEKNGEEYKKFSPLINVSDIKDIIDETDLGTILNMYTHIKVDYDTDVATTRRSVPIILRRSGLYVTYNNGTTWITEFYIGTNSSVETESWVDDSNWQFVPDVDYVNNHAVPGIGSIGYENLDDNLKNLIAKKINVINYPDEEDLTSQNDCLKLKDRESDATKYQSIGYKIIRKNIVVYQGRYTYNLLTEDNIAQHCINIIQYDFTCRTTINLEDDTVIVIKGGKINFTSSGNLIGGRIVDLTNGLSLSTGQIDVDTLHITNNTIKGEGDYGNAELGLNDSAYLKGKSEKGSGSINVSEDIILTAAENVNIKSKTNLIDAKSSVQLNLYNGNLKIGITEGEGDTCTNYGNLNYKQAVLLGVLDDETITEVEGKMVYDSTLKMYKMFNGTSWVKLDGTALPTSQSN